MLTHLHRLPAEFYGPLILLLTLLKSSASLFLLLLLERYDARLFNELLIMVILLRVDFA
jgi:hypothetical protein